MKVKLGDVVHRVREGEWGEGGSREVEGRRQLVRQEEEGEVEREETRLRSEVRNKRKEGNLNLQQIGTILQGSEG